MTETRRQKLLTACAFAKTFQQIADAELRGNQFAATEEALTQLRIALEDLEYDDE